MEIIRYDETSDENYYGIHRDGSTLGFIGYDEHENGFLDNPIFELDIDIEELNTHYNTTFTIEDFCLAIKQAEDSTFETLFKKFINPFNRLEVSIALMQLHGDLINNISDTVKEMKDNGGFYFFFDRDKQQVIIKLHVNESEFDTYSFNEEFLPYIFQEFKHSYSHLVLKELPKAVIIPHLKRFFAAGHHILPNYELEKELRRYNRKRKLKKLGY